MARETVDDEQTLLQVISSDTLESARALEHLCTRFAPMITGLARHLAKDAETGQELQQEGYVELLEALKDFDPGAGVRLSTFLHARIRGRMLQWLRGERRSLTLGPRGRGASVVSLHAPLCQRACEDEDPICPADFVVDESLSARPADLVQASLLRELLDCALRRLSRRQGEALRLLFWQDFSASEIAERLGVSRPRVTALVRSGLINLRTDLSYAF